MPGKVRVQHNVLRRISLSEMRFGTIPSLQLSGFFGEVPHFWGWVHGRGWLGLRCWNRARGLSK